MGLENNQPHSRNLSLFKSILDHFTGSIIALFIALPFFRAFFEFPIHLYFILTVFLFTIGALRLVSSSGSVSRGVFIYTLLFLLLVSWLLFSQLWTISTGQYTHNAYQLTLLLSLMLGIVLSLTVDSARKTLLYHILFAGFAALYVISDYFQVGVMSGQNVAVREAYLTTAILIGSGALVATIKAWISTHRRMLWAAAAIPLLVGTGLSLARGVLIFIIGILILTVILLVLTVHCLKNRHLQYPDVIPSKKALVLTTLFFSLILLLVALNVTMTSKRLNRLISGNEWEYGRGDLWETAVQNIIESPVIGYGLGSNGLKSGTEDRLYPHNMILQVWLDGGIIAVLPLLLWLLIPFIRVLRNFPSNHVWWVPFLACYMLFILESMKSGDFYGARGIVIFGSLAVFSIEQRRE